MDAMMRHLRFFAACAVLGGGGVIECRYGRTMIFVGDGEEKYGSL